jgi:hypothetical protein
LNTRSIIKYLAVLLITGITAPCAGQLPMVKASIDRNQILIGQQLNLKLEASMPDNTYRLSWVPLQDTVGAFNVVTKNKIDSSYSNGKLEFSQQIILTSFDSGRQVLPPLQFTAATLEGDSTFNVYTDSLPVMVSYAATDSIQPFHDIKTIIEVKKSWPWWLWALLALAVALLVFWIIFLIRFFKKKKSTLPLFPSKLSPFDEAMQSLKELEREGLPENQQAKEFHSRLTAIFKKYLSRKTGRYQLYLTSDEILTELKGLDISMDQISAFAASLRMGNAAKFAKYVPPVYESNQCLQQTKDMIVAINNLTAKTTASDL